MMEISQRGETTTVKADGQVYKITYSQRLRRFQIKLNGRLFGEGFNFQQALNRIAGVV